MVEATETVELVVLLDSLEVLPMMEITTAVLLAGLPAEYVFVRGGAPVGRKQEPRFTLVTSEGEPGVVVVRGKQQPAKRLPPSLSKPLGDSSPELEHAETADGAVSTDLPALDLGEYSGVILKAIGDGKVREPLLKYLHALRSLSLTSDDDREIELDGLQDCFGEEPYEVRAQRSLGCLLLLRSLYFITSTLLHHVLI